MKRISWIGLLCVAGLVLLVGEQACGPKVGPCGADYNCPKGLFCVGGACQETPPPQPDAAAEVPVTPDTAKPEPRPEPLPEPRPEPVTPDVKGPCSTHDDCASDIEKPYCWRFKCVKGWAEFDFSKGNTVIADNSIPLAQCSTNAQCPAFRGCSQGVCRNKIDPDSSATGKALDEGIALTDYSTAEVLQRGSTQILRIIMETNFSDRLNKRIEIDIPFDKVKVGDIIIDGKEVTATFYNIRIEFVPSKRDIILAATSGKIQLTKASTTVGQSIGGRAELIFE